VNQWEMLMPLGMVPTWQITCELFEYSGEVFATGISDIDDALNAVSTNYLNYALTDEHGNLLTDDDGNYIVQDDYSLSNLVPLSDNENILDEVATKDYIDFSGPADPFDARPFDEGAELIGEP